MATETEPQPVCVTIERSVVQECIEVLTELCDDLEAEISERYSNTIKYDGELRRFNRDIQPVRRGRKMVEALKITAMFERLARDQQPLDPDIQQLIYDNLVQLHKE